MNSVTLVGRTTRDPELRFTTSGKAVTSFRLAVNRTFSKGDEADFFNIVCWQKTAENVANFVSKGHQVAVNGRLQSRDYEDKDGKKVYVTEVVANEVEFLEKKGNGNNGNQKSQQKSAQGSSESKKNDKNADLEVGDVDLDEFGSIDDDDEIPF